jgi:oxygen-independent coproporphyrinogen-3 oxidase
MWPYHPDLLSTPVPRYTSYPTAAEFSELDPTDYREALEHVEGDISLYAHIPFCEKICFYCGCNTGAAGRRHRLESYLAALHSEIDLVAARLPDGVKVRRVSFGGGSPNAISPVDFIRLVESLTLRFALDEPDFSIELDPRTMNREWAMVLGSVGITRASMGVQTFAPHCQQAIGRVQEDELIKQCVDWLREAGVTSINFDLMYGLPGQSREDLIDSLKRTVELGADRAAAFGYAHVPDMIPRQRVIDASQLPDQAERFAMANDAFGYMTSHGYAPIGFDHFALRGFDPLAVTAAEGNLRRNFQGFTDDPARTLIGLGSSAISSFPHLLAQNEKNSGRYRMMISQEKLTVSRGIRRSADDQLRGRIIEGLLCQGRAEIPPAIMKEVEGALMPFTSRGLATIDDRNLAILPDGLPYARTIAALFDPHRRQSQRRFSSAV